MSRLGRYLMARSPRLSEAAAERLGAKIIAERNARLLRKKADRAAMQSELPLSSDPPPSQGPLDEPEDETVDF